MSIYEDKQMQHAPRDRLQRPTSDSYECKPEIDDSQEDYFIIDRAAFNQGVNAQYDIIIRRGGTAHANSKGSPRNCRPCQSWEKVGALCATDHKWVQQEQVMQGKIIPCIVTH